MRKKIIVNNLERATYKKSFCMKIKYQTSNDKESQFEKESPIYCVDGSFMDSRINTALSKGVLYIFYKHHSKDIYYPVRVSMSAQTIKNLNKQTRKFWHLKPESEDMTFSEYYKK